MKHYLLVVGMLCLAVTASAVMDVPSQGWDGALNITANTVIDLSQAITGTWDTQPPGYVVGKGIYDPEKWAIVFHYTSVTVAAGATVTFTNHPANPPVVWLVEGTTQINGTVTLNGGGATTGEPNGGPGGFRGGRYGILPSLPGGGFGPGGGSAGTSSSGYGSGGGYGSTAIGGPSPVGTSYGNASIIPLIGGSGGGGRYNSADSGGGGGGGAILIGAQTAIVINGVLRASGGSVSYAGPGSGGAVRLITPTISGSGSVAAIAGGGQNAAGTGRIRIEATTQNLGSLVVNPPASIVDPGESPQFWQDSSTPTVRVVSLNGTIVPTSPQGSLVYPHQDVSLSGAGAVTVVLEAMNVATNGTIQVFIVKQGGARTALPTSSVTLIGGNTSLSTWQAVFPAVANGMYAVQARAVLP